MATGIITRGQYRDGPHGLLQSNFTSSSYHLHPLYFVLASFLPSHSMLAHLSSFPTLAMSYSSWPINVHGGALSTSSNFVSYMWLL